MSQRILLPSSSRVYKATGTGAPVTGYHRRGEVVFDDVTGEMFVCTITGIPGTWTEMGGSGAAYAPSGLPGATAATRYVGGTVSGPPLTGTFAVGDWIVDQGGCMWTCVVAGTPGTWTPPVGAQVFYDEKTDNQLGIAAASTVDLANLDAAAFTVIAGQVYEVRLDIPYIVMAAAGGTVTGLIRDAASATKRSKTSSVSSGATNVSPLTVYDRISAPGAYTRKGSVNVTLGTSGSIYVSAAFPVTLTVTRVA